MTTIGITGGIGSGKSTVAGLFEKWGARLADADTVGHAALEEPNVWERLAVAFGPSIVTPDGSIDRRALGKLAFATDESRLTLTDIVWPEVGSRLKDLVDGFRQQGTDVLVIEASLLLERGDPENLYDSVVVVTAKEDIRAKRAANRLNIIESEVRDRMRHQMPEAEKIERADFVIVNDGDLDLLERQARSVWSDLAGGTLKE